MPAGSIQTILGQSRSDALLIYDACQSADTATTKMTPHGITELITSCGFESTAPAVGKTSFTHTLTTVLASASVTNAPLSVAELYGQCLSRLRNAKNRTDQTTPFHCTLTSEKAGRRIILQPLHPQAITNTHHLPIVRHSQPDGQISITCSPYLLD